MPNDGIMIGALAQQLNKILKNGRIEKIVQPGNTEAVLSIHTEKGTHHLLLSAKPDAARMHLVPKALSMADKPPMFCTMLRKALLNGRIEEVVQRGRDRIVDIFVDAADELGDRHVYKLIVEIMGRHSNIILVNEDGRILDAIRHVGLSVSRVRQILPGAEYSVPPEQDGKTDPLQADFGCIEAMSKEEAARYAFQNWIGMSIKTAKLIAESSDNAAQAFAALYEGVKNGAYRPALIIKNDVIVDLTGFCPEGVEGAQFGEASEVALRYFEEKEQSAFISRRASAVNAALSNAMTKLKQKRDVFTAAIKQTEEAEQNRLFAELIQANCYALKKGMCNAELLNYYNGETVSVELDELKTPQENAQAYFKRYRKLKGTGENAVKLKAETEEEILYLEGLCVSAAKAKCESDYMQLEQKLRALGYMREQKRGEGKDAPSVPLHYKTADGYDVFVGKNSAQNEKLTFSASPRDLWFHIKNAPGSHVILRNRKGEFSQNAILSAALLAAYHSSVKGGAKAAVDYTQVRNVDKIHGAKAGMVNYTNQKTVFVAASNEEVAKLRLVN